MSTITALTTAIGTGELAPGQHLTADRHPVAVYLARLAPSGRRSQRHALEAVAAIASNGKCISPTVSYLV